MLHADKLTYTYHHDGRSDLYRYDLRVNAGEVVGILGPSGSGKSTLIDLLAGFLLPAGGAIRYDDTLLNELPPEKRPITTLFQQHNLFEHLTAEQNLLIGLHGTIRGTPEEHARARAILGELGIADQADKVVTALSGGQQQRVALGRALLRRRPILLLDEPFTGLDAATRAEVLGLVRTLTTQQELHTIMVTHEPKDCDAIADDCYEMKKGVLQPTPAEAGEKG